MTDDESGTLPEADPRPDHSSTRMPPWVWKAVIIFWAGYIAALAFMSVAASLHTLILLLLLSLFLALAVEPGVNRLVARGSRRGRATALILGAVVVILVVFVALLLLLQRRTLRAG